MPRKRQPRFSEYKIRPIDLNDRYAVDNHVRVRHLLVDLDEVQQLLHDVQDRLVEALVTAVRIARGGIKVGERHLSNKAVAKHVFLSDVGRAMKAAGLPVTCWRKGGRESLYFGVVHALSDGFGLQLPKDLHPLARQAAQIEFGTMSPTMRAAQDAELAARRRRSRSP
jgi:hypothetical protein